MWNGIHISPSTHGDIILKGGASVFLIFIQVLFFLELMSLFAWIETLSALIVNLVLFISPKVPNQISLIGFPVCTANSPQKKLFNRREERYIWNTEGTLLNETERGDWSWCTGANFYFDAVIYFHSCSQQLYLSSDVSPASLLSDSLHTVCRDPNPNIGNWVHLHQ